MITAIRWVWSQLVRLCELVGSLLSSIWTWVLAFFTWLSSEFLDWIGDLADNVFPSIEWPSIVTDASELFSACVHWFAIDTAIASLGVVLTAWVFARVTRLAMVPIRALLELL